MKIKKMVTFFPGDFHKEDDPNGNYISGDNKLRNVVEIKKNR
ncbi:hypothetical protein [Spiroplasma diminutum]|uniref:Uncharacterized protein n=1 Tax=Spiroplasma diminutum CUAS-1 TaxID=1276221 RepID=S5LWR0_9MOLU|nr:hypothetical protein [Spiroplasma diminutum]AGR42189.1 hypothetical protein SDIMI_v3c04850 [Spiroplasma diminutum CUAS-1]